MISGKSSYYKTWVNRGILNYVTYLTPRVSSFVLKTLNANLEFAVLFLITLVFLLQFLNFGRAKSQVLARWVVNPSGLLPLSPPKKLV